jgi:CO/xanthine dehydrogenase FAD-binding subunit
MKPAPFEYYAPTSVEEALAHLAEHGYDAKVLAGGQSLIPTMNFRLAQPSILIDLNKISDLFFIRPDENGGLRLGAMTRHTQVESNPLIETRTPLVAETMPKIGTAQIRNRGTFGGSIAHADPSAELPAVSVALDGRFRLRSQKGERWVPANEFFVGIFTTLLDPDELLVEVALPSPPPRTGWALEEVARRPHDFALVGVAAVVTLDERDVCQAARIVFLSVGDGPVEALQAGGGLIGQALTSEAIRSAAETAANVDIDPGSDIHASSDFRRHLAGVLARRALERAYKQASGKDG